MKRTLVTLALVAAAGTAGAQTVQMQNGGQPVQMPIGSTMNTGNSATTQPPGGGVPVGNTVTTNSNAPTHGSQMNSNMGASGSAGASSSQNMANAPAPSLTGAAGTAQRRIEMDGYRNVQGLAQGSDGLWHGRAMRGNTEVQVTVDRAGNVSAR
jgi:hypothetical protein